MTTAAIRERLWRRQANRLAYPPTVQERTRAVHAAAYPAGPDGNPICATCHRGDCPRYWRIQNRLDQQEAARRAELLPALYEEEPW